MDHLLGTTTSIKQIFIPLVGGKPTATNHQPPSSIFDFHKYPERHGWKLEDNFKLNVEQSRTLFLDFETFLQRWLYFGLILTVVQKNGVPILSSEDLHTHSERHLTTARLNEAVREWVEWEVKTPENRALRLIRTGNVLEKARSVVRYHCACKVSEAQNSTDDNELRVAITHNYDLPVDSPFQPRDCRAMVHENALTLMLVGECLWAAQLKIIQQCQEDLSGWHGDDDAGWGPPAYVMTSMRDKRWCPRIMHLLKGQLRSNATLLLHAFSVYQNSSMASVMEFGHGSCRQARCQVHSFSQDLNISSQCRKDGPLCGDACKPVGPDGDEAIREILRDSGSTDGKGRIPLLRFRSDPDAAEPNLEVLSIDPEERTPFAAISHVWSDGWGNDQDNKLLGCQLRFIQRQLRQLPGIRLAHGEPVDIPFWMDTLIIPAIGKASQDEDLRQLRSIGIKQIFDVFAKSSFTIILDKGLSLMPYQDEPLDNAMGLLASGWMRRLWTLHEAYLSRGHFIAYQEWPRGGGPKSKTLIRLDNILDNLNVREAPLDFWIHTLLRQNIMHTESKFFAEPDAVFSNKQVAMLVCGAWRAARWRTTSNNSHEAMALATLLNINYTGTEIEHGGWKVDGSTYEAEELIRAFWREFHATYLNCIPSGIIFLPGKKLNLPGYGWAPSTWMSDEEVDFPDPMASWTADTDLLERKGLVVKYPGFRLFTKNENDRTRILSVDKATEDAGFTFAADRSFLEWYTVKPADEEPLTDLGNFVRRQNPLAIILSRSQPKVAPPEIGLLVEIYRIEDQRTSRYGNGHRNQRFRSHIIRRVRVHRETRADLHSEIGNGGFPNLWIDAGSQIHPSDSSNPVPLLLCLGQPLLPDQTWIVDKDFTSRLDENGRPRRPSGSSQTSKTQSPEGEGEGEGEEQTVQNTSAPLLVSGVEKRRTLEPHDPRKGSEAEHESPLRGFMNALGRFKMTRKKSMKRTNE